MYFTPRRLEELLDCDDLFIDYFNVYLQLPIFPKIVKYDRLLGFSVFGNEKTSNQIMKQAFGSTEVERENMLQWSYEERLPYFLETDLFREYKLCKLIKRSPNEFNEQFSSLDSHVNEFDSLTDTIETINSATNLKKFNKSSTFDLSLKSANNNLLSGHLHQFNTPEEENEENSSSLEPSFRESSNPSHLDSDIEEIKRECNTISSGSSLTKEISTMVSRQNMTFQSIKRFLLADRDGMQDFLAFLVPTEGIHLIKFWLDCEAINSSIRSDISENIIKEHIESIRSLEKIYHQHLPEEVKGLLYSATCLLSEAFVLKSSQREDAIQASNTTFNRVQYATLRRLRAYWLPRWVLHWKIKLTQVQLLNMPPQYTLISTDRLFSTPSKKKADSAQRSLVGCSATRKELAHQRMHPPPKSNLSTQSLQTVVGPNRPGLGALAFLSQLSPVWSLSVDLEQIISLISDELITLSTLRQTESFSKEEIEKEESLTEANLFLRFRAAMFADVSCGKPFKSFMLKNRDTGVENEMTFVEELFQFHVSFSLPRANRLDFISNTWLLFNRFIRPSSQCDLALSKEMVKTIEAELRRTRGCVCITLFKPVLEICLQRLLNLWIAYLKKDTLKLLHASESHLDSRPNYPKDENELELVLVDGRISVQFGGVREVADKRRDLSDHMSPSERARRLALAREKRRLMKRERIKDLVAIRRRKQGKSDLLSKKQNESLMEEIGLENESFEILSTPPSDGIPHLGIAFSNRALMNLFQDDLRKEKSSGKGGKRIDRLWSFFKDISDFLALPKSNLRVEKSSFIYRKYMVPNSDHFVKLPLYLRQSIRLEATQPQTPTLHHIHLHILEELNEYFSTWVKARSAKLSIPAIQLFQLAELELYKLFGYSGTTFVENSKHRTAPNELDRVEFTTLLMNCVFHPLTFQILSFYQFLCAYGAQDEKPFADKDLIFCIEASRYKELVLDKADPDLIRKKLTCIRFAFLDSVFPPSLQVTVPQEINLRMLRILNRVLAPRSMIFNASLLDEARAAAFNELLPFWAAFRRHFQFSRQQNSPARMQSITAALVGKDQNIIQQRLALFTTWNRPPPPSRLPAISRNISAVGITCSLTNGLTWKLKATEKNNETGANLVAHETKP